MTYSHTNKHIVSLLLMLSLLLLGTTAQAQKEEEDYWGSLLDTVVENVNVVYKPTVNFSAGLLSFWGDVRNNINAPLNGNLGLRLGASTYVGKQKQLYKMNFFATYGTISGHDFDVSQKLQEYCLANNIADENGNQLYPTSAFRSQMFQAGITFEYNFGHWFGIARRFKPFVYAGVGIMYFTPRVNYNYLDKIGRYHFHSDGTMRDGASITSNIIHFDDNFETNQQSRLGFIFEKNYTPLAPTIPVGVGFDFYLSERVNLRVGVELNYTFSDMLDGYDTDLAKRIGLTPKNSIHDMFTYSYFSMNFDLFSDSKTILIERMFIEIDFDELLLEDQDADWVTDVADLCPDTPDGIMVDSVGCPLDGDMDGVADYIDLEPNTPAGAVVDENGVQLSESQLASMYSKIGKAAKRKEAEVIPLAKIWTRNITYTPGVLPDKFKSVDRDGDGYISFEELLQTINDFFDDRNAFTIDDINELNSFFFTQ
ncbi:MAG: hypothetical protein IKI28_03125 [Bacteroidales bacterium]|nr:hypothetical protein [Bacteroidales bacterium]